MFKCAIMCIVFTQRLIEHQYLLLSLFYYYWTDSYKLSVQGVLPQRLDKNN